MDTDGAVVDLQAHVMALQSVFIGLCSSIQLSGEPMAAIVAQGFEFAEESLHMAVERLPGSIENDHLRRTIEHLNLIREGVEGRSGPKHQV